MPPRYGKISVLHSIWYPVLPLYAPRTLFAASVRGLLLHAQSRGSLRTSLHLPTGGTAQGAGFPFLPAATYPKSFLLYSGSFHASSSPDSMRHILIPDVISHLQYRPSLRYIAITVPGMSGFHTVLRDQSHLTVPECAKQRIRNLVPPNQDDPVLSS